MCVLSAQEAIEKDRIEFWISSSNVNVITISKLRHSLQMDERWHASDTIASRKQII